MNIGPILRRELIEHARRPATQWLRVLGAGVIVFLCWRAVNADAWLLGTSGRPLFQGLNKLMFALIWLVAPVMTADCLSREKREGTIGLLFLTPLRPGEVVLGKVFVHALRGFTVLAAAFPILVLPVLVGGVTLADGVRMLLFHLCALGMGLTAGVLASALATNAVVARLLAFGLTAFGACLFAVMYVTSVTASMWLSNPLVAKQMTYADLWLGHARVLVLTYGPHGAAFNPIGRFGMMAGAGWKSVAYAAAVAFGSALLVTMAGCFAAYGLRKTWRPQEAGSMGGRFVRTWFQARRSPGRRGRLMDINPARWLETRYSGRSLRNASWVAVGVAVGGSGLLMAVVPPLDIRLWIFGVALAIFFARRPWNAAADPHTELLVVTPVAISEWVAEKLRAALIATALAVVSATLAAYASQALLLRGVKPAGEIPWAELNRALLMDGTSSVLWLCTVTMVAYCGSLAGLRWGLSALVAIGFRHLGGDLLPFLAASAAKPLLALDVLCNHVVPAVALLTCWRGTVGRLRRNNRFPFRSLPVSATADL